VEGGSADHECRAAAPLGREPGSRFAGGDDPIVGHGNPGFPQALCIHGCRLARVVRHEDDLHPGSQQLSQRLRRARHRLAPDPDHTIEIDQQAIEFICQCHFRGPGY
jgi:hypothetical protein